jgi:hypothetical protein
MHLKTANRAWKPRKRLSYIHIGEAPIGANTRAD